MVQSICTSMIVSLTETSSCWAEAAAATIWFVSPLTPAVVLIGAASNRGRLSSSLGFKLKYQSEIMIEFGQASAFSRRLRCDRPHRCIDEMLSFSWWIRHRHLVVVAVLLRSNWALQSTIYSWQILLHLPQCRMYSDCLYRVDWLFTNITSSNHFELGISIYQE